MDLLEEFRVLAALAVTDKALAREEHSVLLKLAARRGIDPDKAAAIVHEVASRGHAPPAKVTVAPDLLRDLAALAAADGQISEAEREFLVRVGEAAGLPPGALVKAAQAEASASLAPDAPAEIDRLLAKHAQLPASPEPPPAPRSTYPGSVSQLTRLTRIGAIALGALSVAPILGLAVIGNRAPAVGVALGIALWVPLVVHLVRHASFMKNGIAVRAVLVSVNPVRGSTKLEYVYRHGDSRQRVRLEAIDLGDRLHAGDALWVIVAPHDLASSQPWLPR